MRTFHREEREGRKERLILTGLCIGGFAAGALAALFFYHCTLPLPENRPSSVSSVPSVVRTVIVTAYCPCPKCCGKWSRYGRFADGSPVAGTRSGTVLAAPRNVPFGTVLFLEGIGPAVVRDRGGALKGNRLDLFFQRHQDAVRFGRQEIKAWTR